MWKWLLVLAIVGAVAAFCVVRSVSAIPSNIILGNIDLDTVGKLLQADQQLEQARVRGDFDAFRRLTSDFMFTSTHNMQAKLGRAFDTTTFKPSARDTPLPGYEKASLQAAARVGNTAALFYAATDERPKLGMQSYPAVIHRFVLRNGIWTNDIKMNTAAKVLPSSADQWLAVGTGKDWAIDGTIQAGEPLQPPAAYPAQISLYSDEVTEVKINGELVTETKRAEMEKSFRGTWTHVMWLAAGVSRGVSTIEIVSQRLDRAPTTQGGNVPPPFGVEVEIVHYGPAREATPLYKKEIAPVQSGSLKETFSLDTTEAKPVTCETCAGK